MSKYYKKVFWLFFTLIVITGLAQERAVAQEKMSRRERKEQKKEMMASRLFIEGQKNLMLEEYEKAYFYFNKALEFDDQQSAIYFKLSQMMMRANNPEKAMELGQQALKLDPENKFYHLQMAEIYTKLNRNGEAAAVLENLMERDGDYQRYILDLATIYLNSNEFDKALKALDKAEEYYGIVEQLTAQKQRIYLRKNNLEMAISEGEKLIAAHPGNSQYILALVEILFNNNRTDQALDLVLESLKSYPNQPELKMAAHTLYKQKGNLELSRNFVKEAFRNPDLDADTKVRAFNGILSELKNNSRDQLLDTLGGYMETHHPNDPLVLTALGEWKLRDKSTGPAIAYFIRAIRIKNDNEEVYQKLIPLMFENQEPFAEIVEVAEMATEVFPEKAEFWFFLGTAQLGANDHEPARTALDKALDLNAGRNSQLSQMANGQLGDALYALGEKDAAFDAYQKVLSQNANNEHILNNYAYFLSLEKKELDKAYNMSSKLVSRYPDNATYLDTHAWVLFQLGRYEEARKYMEKAIEYLDTPSGVILEHYGDILFKLGEKEAALKYWNKANEMKETSEFLTLKIKNKTYYE
ncbi:Tfp pilus assembly protein PilF [Cyclobacterium lianum]|uniref:Tfp pilus assembly protein PilF n=1 Tax=Cyclobacterium lianum TaxID=388280 RepID=A0A1M7PWS1_9BACT|nr:tetratricopeptide repeat protein [Cyclobacterium lianum]SHN21973.1 Tfp pilus assembly protein PilF [Cyclobacterium lianum]